MKELPHLLMKALSQLFNYFSPFKKRAEHVKELKPLNTSSNLNVDTLE